MEYDWNGDKLFSSMVGKTLMDIKVADDKETIDFTASDGSTYRQYHSQDCCESVSVDDVCGDLSDLIGSPLTQAEVVTSDTLPEGIHAPEYRDGGELWTFYKMATIKGSVTIRWYGSSNGYYSESVTFMKVSA